MRAIEDIARAPYLSLREAAAYIGITSGALYVRLHRQAVPAWTYSRQGRSYSFMRAALDQWLRPKEKRPAA